MAVAPGTLPVRAAPDRGDAGGRGSAATVVVSVVVAAVVVAVSGTGPVDDWDAWWHVRLGASVVRSRTLAGDAAGWSFGGADPRWRTTEWASEVAMAGAHAVLGWQGLTVLKVLAVAATLFVLAAGTLRSRRDAWTGVVFCAVATGVALDAADRPAVLAYPFLGLAGTWLARLADGRRAAPTAVVCAVGCAWANVHGSSVLLPVGAGGLAVVLAATGKEWRHAARTFVAAAAAGLANPTGWGVYTAPFRLRAAAGPTVMEWRRTGLGTGAAVVGTVLVVLAVVVAAGHRPPVPRAVLVVGCVLLGASAYRNVVPAMLLVAPTLARLVPAADTGTSRPGAGTGRTAVAVVALGLVAGVVLGCAGDPYPPTTPTAAIAVLSGLERSADHVTVLVPFQAAGQVLGLAAPGVRTEADGRADAFGAARILRYDALLDAWPGWQATLAALRPGYALLGRSTTLALDLGDAGWTRVVLDGPWILLRAPSDEPAHR